MKLFRTKSAPFWIVMCVLALCTLGGEGEPIALKNVQPALLKEWFNASAQNVRILTVVSPTCPYCLYGQKQMTRFLKTNTSANLKAFYVWLPMLKGDNPHEALVQSLAARDKRVSQGWDSRLAIAGLFMKTLHLTRNAWDVYLVYAPGTKWEGVNPPTPAFWMHQLDPDSGADPSLALNPKRFSREVTRILNRG